MSSLKQVVCSLILLLPISLSSFANGQTKQPADPKMFADNKPIAIDADNQQIDIENNTITFIGNVVIVQEGLTIKADKVVVTEMQNTEKQKITAYGNPVNYKQILPKNNKIVTGQSSQVIYNVKQNNIVLQGNAELFQQDNHIVSEMIIYDVKKQQIFAQPGKNRRVKSTIIPNQVKEMSK
ncbi:lipopolysaccharide transport periplasmic protein LptA [Gilliamella sp. ESL0250]|uniref:lipopolysaccharide transport periplasmic protein LptA n=1 Tax=Gilliamella sp. ESL0250 TaxID=2705036 RepID=UPI00157FF945|nr:lipopolysaccharide transport periplasmic protein LptA [Gilliamella sp. ESL0250]NUF48316.1 lipopolysaccharide transport periplasmic protein LptA [Gilliamella sp. ESL0250]